MLVNAEQTGLNISLEELSDGLDINSQGAASLLERLKGDGLIDVRFNRGDDRVLSAHVLRVTAEGRRAYETGGEAVYRAQTRERPARLIEDPRVFISHAHEDRALGDSLVELLRLGADVSRQQVFYTSGNGTGVPPGTNFVDHIRGQLQNTVLVVQLLTPAFLSSQFCLCELGGIWVSDTPTFPIAVPPVTHSDLRGILGNIQVEMLDNDRHAVDLLHDAVRTALGLNSDTASWNRQRAAFLARLPAILRQIGPARPLTPSFLGSRSPRERGQSVRKTLLHHLANIHDQQSTTSAILEPDLEKVAKESDSTSGAVRRELGRLLTEGLLKDLRRASVGRRTMVPVGLRAPGCGQSATIPKTDALRVLDCSLRYLNCGPGPSLKGASAARRRSSTPLVPPWWMV